MTTLYTSDKHLLSWDVFLVFELGTWGTFIRMAPSGGSIVYGSVAYGSIR